MIIYSGNYSLPDRVLADTGISNRIGLLTSYPNHPPKDIKVPYIGDNKKYSVWTKNITWDKESFIKHLNFLSRNNLFPTFIVCPDVPTDADATNREWKQWFPILKFYGFSVAFAAQNGHQPKDIPSGADWVFIGGDRAWKLNNIKTFCDAHPNVHVARINSLRWLWVCHLAGAKSVDGNGWFRQKRGSSTYGRSCYQDLIDYIRITEGRQTVESECLFHLGQYTNFQGVSL